MADPRVICRECGDEENVSRWSPDLRQRLLEHGLCFTCEFWQEKVNWRAGDDPHAFVGQDFVHYRIGEEGAPYPGFGGRTFEVAFDDGRRVTTSNLWCQGQIPERWRGRLSPNATVKEADRA